MRIVSIIPARGGSKRIPKKNIKMFHGKPIIIYSIDAAKESKLFEIIICSTDDDEIASIAKKNGAECPFIRPFELSDDCSSTSEVINHSIDYLEDQKKEFNLICCIYPTAPFITSYKIIEGYNKIKNDNWDYVFSASKNPISIFRTFEKKSNNSIQMLDPHYYLKRTQDLTKTYYDAAQFYWGKKESWKKKINIFDKYSTIVEIPYYESIDIDTIEDWKTAELFYEKKFENEKNT